jgi:hypothetical protein
MNKIVEILESHNLNGFEKPGGTDKAEGHSYDTYYSLVLEKFTNKKGKLLEIGVQYGGSALLWHDYLPHFDLYLVDIRDQVFPNIWENMSRERYTYRIMDAFNMDSIKKISEENPEGFDIIIEDGPHTLESQFFAIKEYSKLLKKGGILIIEDVQKIEYADILTSIKLDFDYESLELIDLRHIKNRYDDLLIVLKK